MGKYQNRPPSRYGTNIEDLGDITSVFRPLYKESQLFFGPWAIIVKSLKPEIEAMEKDYFDHNLVRKVEAMDLPKEIKMRRKDEITALKIERLRRETKKRSGNDGDQATLELITELAWQRFEQLQDIDQAIDAAANS